MISKRSEFFETTNTDRLKDGFLITTEDRQCIDLSLPTEDEQQLAAWNATEKEYPTDVCVAQLVARQSASTPDAVALVGNGQVLNYRELSRRSNQLAHYLQALM